MSHPDAPDARTDLRTAYRAAMRRFAATVTIITTTDGARRHGMTVTAVTALSLDPPSLIACINRATLLHDILLSGQRFCVNVLCRDQAALSTAFSGALPPETRFDLGAWSQAPDGLRYLADAQARLFCRKAAMIPYGSHSIVVGEIEEVAIRDGAEPLLYHDATYCMSVPAAPGAA